jgi:hypothetical protein
LGLGAQGDRLLRLVQLSATEQRGTPLGQLGETVRLGRAAQLQDVGMPRAQPIPALQRWRGENGAQRLDQPVEIRCADVGAAATPSHGMSA